MDETCLVEGKKEWNCIVCNKKVHGAHQGCTCSAYRQKDFNLASVCTRCCAIYDRVLVDKELQAVLRLLFKKYYYAGEGSTIEF